jgi:hypothetical protein
VGDGDNLPVVLPKEGLDDRASVVLYEKRYD